MHFVTPLTVPLYPPNISLSVRYYNIYSFAGRLARFVQNDPVKAVVSTDQIIRMPRSERDIKQEHHHGNANRFIRIKKGQILVEHFKGCEEIGSN